MLTKVLVEKGKHLSFENFSKDEKKIILCQILATGPRCPMLPAHPALPGSLSALDQICRVVYVTVSGADPIM